MDKLGVLYMCVHIYCGLAQTNGGSHEYNSTKFDLREMSIGQSSVICCSYH